MRYDQWKTTDPAMERAGRLEDALDRLVSDIEREWTDMGLFPGEVPEIEMADFDADALADEETEGGNGNARMRAEIELETWFESLEGNGPYEMTVTKWVEMDRLSRKSWLRKQRAFARFNGGRG